MDRPPELPPKRQRSESDDWRFAICCLGVLLLATLVTSLVLYVQDDSVPEGMSNLASALVGALIVLIGRRMTDL